MPIAKSGINAGDAVEEVLGLGLEISPHHVAQANVPKRQYFASMPKDILPFA